jgi:hypothetical protein
MINLEFCKQRLLEAAEFETVGGVRPQVTALTRRLLKVRLPTAKDRAALRLWAETGLRKRETEPGSGTSRIVPSAMLTKISREMAMFQTVLEVLDEVDGSAAA